jgi:MSHA pilin protein MshD
MSIRSGRRGFTLVEMVVLITVLAIGLAGILLTFQVAVKQSVDPQLRKQSLAIAEAMLEEILLNSYDPLPGTGSRANFDDVDDYNGYTTGGGGIVDINGVAVAGLSTYNVSVSVAATGLNSVAEAKRVTVTVKDSQGHDLSLDGYRVRYVGP